MKRWVVFVVLVVALSAAGTVLVQWLPTAGSGDGDLPMLSNASDDAKGPKPRAVVVGDKTYEFGTMPQRAVGKHGWTVKNEGQADLELWMISSTCSCTLAKFKDGAKAVVKPGETTEIELEFETRENNGEYGKSAEIGSNDPALPQFTLAVHGKVFPAVMTIPNDPNLNYGTVSNDQDEHKARVAVFSRDRPETKVVKVTASNPNVTATVAPLKDEEVKAMPGDFGVKAGQAVTVVVKSGFPLGLFREEVILTTDHPKQPEIRLSVSGRMVGPVNVIPASISMHEVYSKAGATGEFKLVVRGNRETKFEVVKKPERLRVEVVPDGPTAKPGRYKLVITVPPGTPAERIEDEVVLKTDHPKAESVHVPLSIWVLNAN